MHAVFWLEYWREGTTRKT